MDPIAAPWRAVTALAAHAARSWHRTTGRAAWWPAAGLCAAWVAVTAAIRPSPAVVVLAALAVVVLVDVAGGRAGPTAPSAERDRFLTVAAAVGVGSALLAGPGLVTVTAGFWATFAAASGAEVAAAENHQQI